MAKEAERIGYYVRNALCMAYNRHQSLGALGEARVQKNRFGDTALRADVECEEAVLGYLRNGDIPNHLGESGIQIRVISEEHGVVDIGKGPRYLGILDGIDGSSVYEKAHGKGRYATMFAILDGTDPTYNDYVASGIIEHRLAREHIAYKSHGANIDEFGELGLVWRVSVSSAVSLTESTTIYIGDFSAWECDVYERKLKRQFPKSGKHGIGSSAMFYADLADGNADVVIECTMKGNLEIGVAYGIVKEAGGVMVDIDGNDIGAKKFLEWGQKEALPVISAANMNLARQVIRHLR